MYLYLHFLVQESNPNPVAAPSAPTTNSSRSVFALSQSIDINTTVDFTVPTVSRAPDHQGERGTHHEEHPVIVNQAVPENIVVEAWGVRRMRKANLLMMRELRYISVLGWVNVCSCSLVDWKWCHTTFKYNACIGQLK